MALITKKRFSVEERPEVKALWGLFRAIPRLRVRADEDGTPIGWSCREAWARDKLYPVGSDRLGLYVERATVNGFKATVRALRRKLVILEEMLGDQDGILFFAWDQAVKLPQFFRRVGVPGNIERLKGARQSKDGAPVSTNPKNSI